MAGAARSRYRDALRQRDFRLLVAAALIDICGSWAQNVVLVVYLYTRTGTTTILAVSLAVGLVPGLILAPYASLLGDRFDRRTVMLTSALASTIVVSGLAGAVAADAPIPLLLAIRALAASVATPYAPAAGALIPEVLEEKHLAAGNAFFAGVQSVTVLLGPGLGGLLLLTGEPFVAVAVNAASFLIAALIVAQLRTRSTGKAAAAGESLLTQMSAGVRAILGQPVARTLIAYCALDSAVYGASTVLYVPISKHLGTGPSGYGYLLIGNAVGAILLTSVANRLSTTAGLAPIILAGMLALALPFPLTAVVHTPVLGFALQVVAGAGMVVVDVLALTALQRDLPREVMSRVMGAFWLLIDAAILSSSFLFSGLLRAFGLTSCLVILGVGFSAVSVLGLRPLLRADDVAREVLARLEPKIAELEQLDLFAAATRQALQRLAASIEEVTLPAREVVVREGEPADALWVLVSGEVAVKARGEGSRVRRLGTQGAGTYFGEIGLLRAVPRTATVVTTQPSVLWRISGGDFLTALEGSTTASDSLLGVSQQRLARSHPHLATQPPSPPAESG